MTIPQPKESTKIVFTVLRLVLICLNLHYKIFKKT